MAVQHSVASVHNVVFGPLAGVPAPQPFEPFSGPSGSLSNGTTWSSSVANAPPGALLIGNDGNTRLNNSGTLTTTFSAPVNILIEPTTDQSGGILNPINWSRGGQTGAPFPSQVSSPDALPVYTPGVVDAALIPNPDRADAIFASLAQAAAPRAGQGWGSVSLTGVTVFSLRSLDSDAWRITIQGT